MISLEEVFNSKTNKYYTLDQVLDLYDDNKDGYKSIENFFCCPSCNSDKLTISINDELGNIKCSEKDHLKSCDYYGFKLSQKKIKERIKNKIGFDAEFDDIIDETYELKKSLPKKSLMRNFVPSDYNVYKLFYGDVIIKKAYSKDEEKYLNYSLKAYYGDPVVITIQKKHFKKLENVINKLENNIDEYVTIYFLGIMNQVDEYNNLLIEHDSLLRIRR